jgi:hypothetical protein
MPNPFSDQLRQGERNRRDGVNGRAAIGFILYLS